MITVSFDNIADMQDFINFVTGNMPIRAIPQPDDLGLADMPSESYNVPTSPFEFLDDIMDMLNEGDIVRWEGSKFQFTGKLVEDPFYNDNGDEVVRIKRDDTGKIVKITFDLHENGKLYLVSKAGDDVPAADPIPVDNASGTRISRYNLGSLQVGDSVDWHGAKYSFYGIVERVDLNVAYDDKMVFVRRSDTNKLVSLTGRDLDDHKLVLL